jgi:hypothetical protein
MSTQFLTKPAQQSYISSLDEDACKETLRFASKEAMQTLVPFLSPSQYYYAKKTLPEQKAAELESAWNLHQKAALKI